MPTPQSGRRLFCFSDRPSIAVRTLPAKAGRSAERAGELTSLPRRHRSPTLPVSTCAFLAVNTILCRHCSRRPLCSHPSRTVSDHFGKPKEREIESLSIHVPPPQHWQPSTSTDIPSGHHTCGVSCRGCSCCGNRYVP